MNGRVLKTARVTSHILGQGKGATGVFKPRTVNLLGVNTLVLLYFSVIRINNKYE